MQGTLSITLAAMLWSSGGVLIKAISLDPYQISFWRSLFAILTIFAIVKPRELHFDFYTLLASFAYAFTLIFFVIATKLTTAANAILLQYTAPIYVLLLSRFLLNESVRGIQLFFVALAILGMGIFFLESLSPVGLIGNTFAIMSGFFFGLFLLLARKKKREHPIDAVMIGNGLIVVGCSTFMMIEAAQNPLGAGNDEVLYGFAISTADSVMVAFLGILQIGIPYILFTRGIRFVRALDASLIAMLEPVLNPLWVFLFVGEIPSVYTILGGSIILSAVALQSIFTTRSLNIQLFRGV